METSALTIRKFDLDTLCNTGVEPAFVTLAGRSYFESLKLVYDYDCPHHESPTFLIGENIIRLKYELSWKPVENTSGIPQESTRVEEGACAVAMLVISHETDFHVAGSSAKGKRKKPIGADFVLSLKSRTPDERKAQVEAGRNAETTYKADGLLEVSGTLQISEQAANWRMYAPETDKNKGGKIVQIQRNSRNRRTTCIVIVVDFWQSMVLTEIIGPSNHGQQQA